MENYQQKQEITPSLIQDLVRDLRAGWSEEEIARKYGLPIPKPPSEDRTEPAPPEFHESSQHPSNAEICRPSADPTVRETEESSYICPTCLTAFTAMFDICPNCSASVQESLGRCEDVPTPEIALAAKECQIPAGQAESKPSAHQSNEFSVPHQTLGQPITLPRDEREDQGIPAASPSPETQIAENVRAAESKTSAEHDLRNRPSQGPLPVEKSNRPERQKGPHSAPSLRCESCRSAMTPALRDIYDRSRGVQSLLAAAAFFLLGYFCCILLNFLDTPSVPRLTVFFAGCLSLVLGSVLTAVGAFMYLAREKVYFCTRCKRTYPRADISYLTAALVWSSKRASGSL